MCAPPPPCVLRTVRMPPFSRLALASTLLVALATPASAQLVPDLSEEALPGAYEVVAGPDGTFVCEPRLEEPVGEAQLRAQRSLNLTALPSLNPPEQLTGLRIVLRATDQLLARPEALISFRRAAARWERAIKTPITVVYDIDYGPTRFGGDPYGSSTIASATSASDLAQFDDGTYATPANIFQTLSQLAAGDAQLQQLYAAAPSPLLSTVTGAAGANQAVTYIFGGQPTLQVLGFVPARLDPDPAATPFGSVPNLGFNSAFGFDFDPNDGVDPNLIDFEAIVIHEMGHSLGFTSAIGFAQQSFGVLATPWDLFRVRPNAVRVGESLTDGQGYETALRVLTPGPAPSRPVPGDPRFFLAEQAYFDGINLFETSTATGGGAGGDGQQASHWRDDSVRPPSPLDTGDRYIGIMDPNFGPGVRQLYKYPDLRVLEVLGYGVDFSPTYATGVTASLNGTPLDLTGSLRTREVALGDVPVGGSRQVPLQFSAGAGSPEFAYDVEVVIDSRLPAGATASVSLAAPGGTVAAGGTASVPVTLTGGNAPAFFTGRLRARTNFERALVVEVPFTFGVGGATEPVLTVAEADGVRDGDLGSLGNLEGNATASTTVTLGNQGNIALGYEVVTALKTRKFAFPGNPPATVTDGSGGAPSSRALEAFVGARLAARADVLFSTTFDQPNPLGAFSRGGSQAGDWQLVTGGSAALPGHSAPRALYFGQVPPDGAPQVYQYRNDATGRILLPALDLSRFGPDDLPLLTFNYYLQAEEGFDFASVVFSVDGGATFQEATSSDQGLLTDTEDGWASVMVTLGALSGLPDPVLVGFQFVSDSGVTDEGWYVDDVEVSVLDGVNPFFATPRTGAITGPTATQAVTLTAQGGFLERGFYEGEVSVETDQRFDDPAPLRVRFTVDSPALPTLTPSEPSFFTSVNETREGRFDASVTNTGNGPLSYVRLMEPALSRFGGPPALVRSAPPAPARDEAAAVTQPTGPLAAAPDARVQSRAASATAAALGSVALPTDFALGMTQLPDGRVVVTEVAGASATAAPRTFLVAEDLSAVQTLPGATPDGQQILGLAYNDRTGTLWYSAFQSGLVYEVRLGDNGLERTGRSLDLGFQVLTLDYSPELDAFLIIPFRSDLLYAYDANGNSLPGWPVQFQRGSQFHGLSVSGGVVEIGFTDLLNGDQLTYLQYDQFARQIGSVTVDKSDPALGGTQALYELSRSRVTPNGRFYALTRAPQNGQARVVALDPPDLAPSTQSFVSALRPAFGNDQPAGRTAALPFRLNPQVPVGQVAEETVAFLTNNPAAPVVRVPVRVEVRATTPVVDEPEGVAFGVYDTRPNPARDQTEVRFGLPDASDVTVEVYNVIGQRVAVLAAGDRMTGGVHALPLDTGRLAAGVYVVRVRAGDRVGTRKLTVIR